MNKRCGLQFTSCLPQAHRHSEAGSSQRLQAGEYEVVNKSACRLASKRGFTLLELLVSVGILSMAVILVMALFTKGIDVWQDARFNSSAVYNAVLFLDSVEKELKNYADFSGVQFSGNGKAIVFPSFFKTDADSAYRKAGCIKYVFDAQKENVYKYSASYPQCLQESSFIRVKVLDSIKTLVFSYGTLNPEQQIIWLSEWGEDAGIPAAVKIKVQISLEGKAGGTYEFAKIIYIPIA